MILKKVTKYLHGGLNYNKEKKITIDVFMPKANAKTFKKTAFMVKNTIFCEHLKNGSTMWRTNDNEKSREN